MKYKIKLFDCAGNELTEFEKDVIINGNTADAYKKAQIKARQWEDTCYEEDDTVDWYEIFDIST